MRALIVTQDAAVQMMTRPWCAPGADDIYFDRLLPVPGAIRGCGSDPDTRFWSRICGEIRGMSQKSGDLENVGQNQRIGFLGSDRLLDVFRTALSNLGYVESRNIIIESRGARYSFGAWLTTASERLHRNKLAVALANKLARIAWSVLRNEKAFDTHLEAVVV